MWATSCDIVQIRADVHTGSAVMLTAERKDLLLSELGREGRLVARDLARRLGTSEDTIRRDLRELAAEGRLQRVHGGALPVSPALAPLRERATIAPEGKASVAALAASLVRPGQTTIVDGGTTALALVQHLSADLEGTIVTHSPTIAVALAALTRVDVLVLGGRMYRHSVVACGAITAEAARSVHADVCFIGVTGVHPRSGLTTGDPEEAAIKRVLAGQAAETYVLASSEKVGAVSAHRVMPWSMVTAVLTDPAAPRGTVSALRSAGVDVRIGTPSHRRNPG